MQDHNPVPPQPNPPESRPARTVPKGVIAGLTAVVLAVGGGVAWWTWHSFQAQNAIPGASVAPSLAPDPSNISQAPIEQKVQVYWLKSVDNRFELAPTSISVTASGQPESILKAAFEEMLKGTSTPDFSSTVPEGTKLRQITVKDDGVHVNLSQEFTSGGGSASMTGRLGQVIYTATTLEPTAPVWISVEGKPLEVLGGEGLLLDQPMTREKFEQEFTL